MERNCALVEGRPAKPQLAAPASSVKDAIEAMKGSSFVAEMKYDGQRAQIHVAEGGRVQIFSRHCLNTTAAFPDVVAVVQNALCSGTNSLVVDSELVGVDTSSGKLHAFQVGVQVLTSKYCSS